MPRPSPARAGTARRTIAPTSPSARFIPSLPPAPRDAGPAPVYWNVRRIGTARGASEAADRLSNAQRGIAEEVVDLEELGEGAGVGVVFLGGEDGVSEPWVLSGKDLSQDGS